MSSRTTSVPGATDAQDCRGPGGEHQGSFVQGFCGCAAAHWIDNIYHQWTLQDILNVEIDATLDNSGSQIRITDKRCRIERIFD